MIDAAEWCCPKPDMTFGFQKVLKHYYLQGLHQVVVNADIYINGDVWRKLTPGQQKAIEVSANASLMKTVAYRINENGKALKELIEKHGVILHDTPPEYFKEYGAAAMKNFETNAPQNPFFKKVWDSQKAFADLAIPFWAERAEVQCGAHRWRTRTSSRRKRSSRERCATSRGRERGLPPGAAAHRRTRPPGAHAPGRACARLASARGFATRTIDDAASTELIDEMIAARRADPGAGLPDDMPPWMSRTIIAIDTFSLWVGRAVSWISIPLMFAMVYEVVARYAFTAPTVWAYDMSRMLYGAMFVLGAGYALSKGVHIRSDFLYRKWAIRTQGRVDTALYLVFYFPAMLIFLWVATQWGWASVVRGERGIDTAWMPLLGPVEGLPADRHRVPAASRGSRSCSRACTPLAPGGGRNEPGDDRLLHDRGDARRHLHRLPDLVHADLPGDRLRLLGLGEQMFYLLTCSSAVR